EVPQQSVFALVEIPALAVSAAAVYEKKSSSQTTSSLLADLLNDVYASWFAEEGGRMDELAQKLLEDEGTQQQVLLLAEEIYSTTRQQVETTADPVAVSQPPTQDVVSAPVAVEPATDSSPPLRSNGAFWGLLAVWVTLSVLFIRRGLRLTAFRSAAQEGEDDADPEASEDAVAGAAEEIPRQWSLEVLQALEWKRFETVCYEYLRATGYRPQEIRIGFDGAVDFKVYMPDIEKPVGLVRCRGGMAGRIDVQALRDLLDVMTEAKIRNGKFITSGEFDPEAAAFAHGRNLQLLSGRELLASLLRLPEKNQLKLLRMIVRGDYHTPTCPRCGHKMILRAGPGETFWECPKYPRCQATMRRLGKNN
ncbi:MAG: restriction endonuclease, partial [Desulfuromonadaceae bacterium]